MKSFILGVAIILIVGIWIALAMIGIISAKTAILVPVGLVVAALLFGLWYS